MTVVWCIIPQIWSEMDRIFCNFGPFFAWRYYHFTHVYHKWKSYDVWFLRYGAWWAEFCVILDHFLHFYPPNNPKNQNFEKMKKPPRDIITLHMCTINENHMIYGSWDMERDGQNFLSFWTAFCPFTPLTTRKIKILKKWKKNPWRHYHFTNVYHKLQSYDVWFLRYWTWRTESFVILDRFLPFYPLTTQKIKILKNWKKKHLEISSFYTSVAKIMIICYPVP